MKELITKVEGFEQLHTRMKRQEHKAVIQALRDYFQKFMTPYCRYVLNMCAHCIKVAHILWSARNNKYLNTLFLKLY